MSRTEAPSSKPEAAPATQLVEPQGAAAVLRDRVQAITDALTLFRGLELASIENSVGQAVAAYAKASRLLQEFEAAADDPSSEAMRAAQEAATEAQRALLAVHKQVSTAAFCRAYDRSTPSVTVAARYARLLASSGLENDVCRMLYEFVVCRLLRREEESGEYGVAPMQESAPLLDYVAPIRGRSASADKRRMLLGQLEAAAVRISAAEGHGKPAVGELDEELDRLRNEIGTDLADPDLLQALARVSNAIANKARFGPEARPPRDRSGGEDPGDEQEGAAVPEQAAAAQPSSTDDAHARVLAVREVYTVLRDVGIDAADQRLHRLEETYADSVQAFELLELTEFTDGPAQERFAAAAEAAEAAALRLNQIVPMESFARRFNSVGASTSSITRFLCMLSSGVIHDGERRDQFEFLATRLLQQEGNDGLQQVLPREEAVQLLEPLARSLTNRTAKADRAGAEKFFDDASAKIAEVASFEELISSGLYAEIYRFKLSLRGLITDPAIAYSAAKTNIALANRLCAFADGSEPEDSQSPLRSLEGDVMHSLAPMLANIEFDARFPKERRKVQDAAGRPPSKTKAKAAAKGDAKARQAEAEAPAEEVEASSPAARAKVKRRVAVALVCALLLIAAVVPSLGNPYPTTAYSAAQAQRLSPHLAGASMLEEQQVFLGELQAATWRALSSAERADEAAKLRRNLEATGVSSAIVSLDGRPVIRFRAGGPLQLMD